MRTAALVSTAAVAGVKAASAPPVAHGPIVLFSKPFETLGPEDTAALVAEVGCEGIECPVRAKPSGQVAPTHVEEVLPRYVEAFRRRGLDIPLITTDITALGQPNAERVLRAAARLGIKRARLGFIRYAADRPILAQVDEIGRRLKDIGDFCGELGLQAGVENHSGSDIFGAPIWDFYTALQQHQVKNVGICFDIGHATVEGGLSWPIQARLVESNLTAVYFKDFNWRKGPKGWQPEWCPLGQGMIDPGFARRLGRSGFTGPISLESEYPLGDRAQMVAALRHDLLVLKRWLGDIA
jgi:sugar phosphate isomerase/epimerase